MAWAPVMMIGKSSVISRGFTIVELLVALAVAAVLLALAVPSFNGFIAQRDITSRVNDFVLSLNYARSEAARVGGLVTVQAINPGAADNEWGPGFCVVQNNPGDCSGTRLRSFDGYADGTFDGLATLDGIEAFGFNSRGLMTVGAAGTIDICHTDTDIDPGRTVTISAIGRASVSELTCHP